MGAELKKLLHGIDYEHAELGCVPTLLFLFFYYTLGFFYPTTFFTIKQLLNLNIFVVLLFYLEKHRWKSWLFI